MTINLENIYNEGYNACAWKTQGYKPDCPYPKGQAEWYAWMAGWYEAYWVLGP